MKNALKKYYTYLFATLFIAIAVGVVILVMYLNKKNNINDEYILPIILGSFAAGYLLIGFLSGDIYKLIYRKKNHIWDDELPEKTKDVAWLISLPFYIASFVVFMAFMVLQIISWMTGHFPTF